MTGHYFSPDRCHDSFLRCEGRECNVLQLLHQKRLMRCHRRKIGKKKILWPIITKIVDDIGASHGMGMHHEEANCRMSLIGRVEM